MPFFLISQDFLTFTNLNCQWKIYNFNQKLERLSKLLWFQWLGCCFSYYLTVYHVVPPSVLVMSHFLILSRNLIGTAQESSCFIAGTGKTGLFVILMISDQCTYTCLHHNIPFYEFISHILTFFKFPDFSWLGSGISACFITQTWVFRLTHRLNKYG